MIVGSVDRDAGARIGIAQRAQESLIGSLIARNVVFQIHGLNAEIEPLGGRIGGLGVDGVPFAQDRRFAVDQKRDAGAGIDENGFPDHDPFERFQFDA